MLLPALFAATSTLAPADSATVSAPLSEAERRFAEQHLMRCPKEWNATYGRGVADVVLREPREWTACRGLAQQMLTAAELSAFVSAVEERAAPPPPSRATQLASIVVFGAGATALFAGGVTALLGGLRGDDKGESLAVGGGLIAAGGLVVGAIGIIAGLATSSEEPSLDVIDAHNRGLARALDLEAARGEAWARTSSAGLWAPLDRVRDAVAPELLHPVHAVGFTPIEWVHTERGTYAVGGVPVRVAGVHQGAARRFLSDAELHALLGPVELPPPPGPTVSAWIGGTLMVGAVIGGLAGITATSALDEVPSHMTFVFDAVFVGGTVFGAMVASYAGEPDARAGALGRAIQDHNAALAAAALRRASTP